MTPKACAPSTHSFHYFVNQHISKLYFKALTKPQYGESALFVRSVFTFNLQKVNAFLLNDQRYAQFFSMYLFIFFYIFLTLHVSSTSCSSSGETNCVNTTSGSCQWPYHVQVGSSLPTCT